MALLNLSCSSDLPALEASLVFLHVVRLDFCYLETFQLTARCLLQTHGPFSERAAAAVAYETLKVISLCHTKAMVHGDIKPSNLMLLQVCCCFFGVVPAPLLVPASFLEVAAGIWALPG